MKVDVCVNVFGKPYQTLVTLKSLIEKCGENIDKIYYVEEVSQPQGYDFKIIKNNLGYKNIERYIPKHHLPIGNSDKFKASVDPNYRLSLRYQYGLEKTNKKYLLIIHNDILFTDNIVSDLISNIGDCFTIGDIGQCWNCPLKKENICDGDLLEENIEKKISFEEILSHINKHPSSRTATHGRRFVDESRPLPLPECRVNEWCALIDVEKYRKESVPNGDVHPFGGYFGIDLADIWFKEMVHKGYKFKHYDIYKSCTHAFFSEVGHGHSALFNKKMYDSDEERAKKYFKTTYQ